jgi:PKD repeat protein
MRKIYTLLLVFAAMLSSSLFAQCNPEFTFTANGSNGAIQFLPVNTAGGTSHSWLFGDGTSSNAVAPLHVYAPGTYNVIHIVTYRSPGDSNASPCIDSAVRWVTVAGQQPCNITASYTFTRDSSQANQIYFSNLSAGVNSNTITRWVFGDGTASLERDPIHIYALPGTYTVCLTVINDSLCTDSICNTVQVQAPANPCNLSVDFIAYPDSSYQAFRFYNLVSPQGAADSVQWLFGDGTSSTELNPLHTYSQPGTYTVCLIVRNFSGASPCVREYCRQVTVQGIPCNMSAAFTFTRDSVQTNKVYFTNISAGTTANTTTTWNFGDGSIAYGNNPTHIYQSAGTYTVCLSVRRDSFCVSDTCGTVQVQLLPDSCDLSVNFTASIDSLNTGTIHFASQGTSISATDSVTWVFGDGTTSHDRLHATHTYTQGGIFNVCLMVRKNGTATTAPCVREFCQRIIVDTPQNACNLAVNFTASIDSLHTNSIHFTNLTTPLSAADSIVWMFGDGTISHDVLHTTHTYTQGGVFNVCLVVRKSGNNGAAPCIREFCQRIIVDTPQNSCNLQAYFVTRADSTYNNKIYFINQSAPMVSGDSAHWSFGDGTSSADLNPVHTYNAPGTYTVCLLVKRFQSGNVVCARDYCQAVVVTQQPAQCNLVADFNYYSDSISGNNPLMYQFTNTSTPLAAIDSSIWDFGDGTSWVVNHTEPVTHTYAAPGTYTACLWIMKSASDSFNSACDRRICKTIVVTGPVNDVCDELQVSFNWSADSVNKRKIYFINQSSPLTANTFTSWSFGDGDSTMSLNPEHIYAQPGTYTVCLRIRLGNSCVKDSCTIVVIPPVDSCNSNLYPAFTSYIDSFNRRKVYFSNTTATASPGLHAQWSFGDGTAGSGWNTSHEYAMPGWYAVCLTVSTSNTCTKTFCDSIFVPGNVIPPVNCDTFQLRFTYRRDFMPNKLFFHATSNAPVYNQQWTFTQLGDSAYTAVNQNNPVYVFPDTGVYKVCVKAAFSTACIKEFCDEVRIYSRNLPTQCRLACYPNPTRNQVSFDVQLNAPGMITASVLSFHNLVVRNYTRQGVTGNNQVTLDIRDLPRGIYTIRTRYGGNVCFTRFIKF